MTATGSPSGATNTEVQRKAPATVPLGPGPDADLNPARVRPLWTALCFCATFLLYVAFIPHFLLYSSPPTGDQPFYLMDADSLAQDGDLELSNNYANRDYDKFYCAGPASSRLRGHGRLLSVTRAIRQRDRPTQR